MPGDSDRWHRAPMASQVRVSPPLDTTEPYDPSGVSGKTIVITGGASGFGEGFFRKWASLGANCIIGDINDSRGKSLVDEVRKSTKNNNHHYIHCDVTDWQSQVDFFREAEKLSPHRGIDSIVANAGIADPFPTFQDPRDMDTNPTPPKPDFKCFEVDMVGVMYTAHLAYFYLPRNPGSQSACPPAPTSNNTFPTVPKKTIRDRHLLLIGSCASIMAIPGQVLYNISKHGVLGMFRSLRATTFMSGVRINLLMPYFIDTPILPAPARALLAGGATGKPEDVVDAGTRLMADASISGHGLVIGPRVRADVREDGEFVILPSLKYGEKGKEMAVWEAYAHDWEEVDAFSQRFIGILSQVEWARGWVGFCLDMGKAFVYPFTGLWRR